MIFLLQVRRPRSCGIIPFREDTNRGGGVVPFRGTRNPGRGRGDYKFLLAYALKYPRRFGDTG